MLQVDGGITYNGFSFDEFVVQRTAAYIDQVGFRLLRRKNKETALSV